MSGQLQFLPKLIPSFEVAIRDNTKQLCEQLVTDRIADYLYVQRMISARERDCILDSTTPDARVAQLIHIVLLDGRRGFEVFCQALYVTTHTELLDKLTETDRQVRETRQRRMARPLEGKPSFLGYLGRHIYVQRISNYQGLYNIDISHWEWMEDGYHATQKGIHLSLSQWTGLMSLARDIDVTVSRAKQSNTLGLEERFVIGGGVYATVTRSLVDIRTWRRNYTTEIPYLIPQDDDGIALRFVEWQVLKELKDTVDKLLPCDDIKETPTMSYTSI